MKFHDDRMWIIQVILIQTKLNMTALYYVLTCKRTYIHLYIYIFM